MEPTMREREDAMALMQVLFSFGFKDALVCGAGKGYCNWKGRPETQQVLKDYGLDVTCGASKVCIYSTDDDEEKWVVKVGFIRAAFDVNFCELEAKYYAEAVSEDCASHLAETYYCGTIDGVDIFLQERVELQEDFFEEKIYDYVSEWYNEDDESMSEEEREECIDNDMHENCSSEDYIMAVLGDTVESCKLIRFCEKNKINDLHELNWGVARDGNCKLIDFSGYRN